MSFGLGRGRPLDPGRIGLTLDDLPPLPDAGFGPRRAHVSGAAAQSAPDPARVSIEPPPEALLDPRAWFEHPDRPFEIEIGSGKGTFLLEAASRRPEVNILGFEWAKEFYLYAADRCRRRALDNVRLLNADATEFFHWRTPGGIASVIHLYFSDPWPKSRHHKRRVVQDRFLADAHRVLAPGGELRIVTDHDDYWQWMEEHFARWCAPDGSRPFDRVDFDESRRPIGAAEGELVGTNFERKYAREGRPFHAAALRKVASPTGAPPAPRTDPAPSIESRS